MRIAVPPGFLTNDPRYAPFGLDALRGLTPARLAVLVAVIATFCSSFAAMPIAEGKVGSGFEAWLLAVGRNLACALPGLLLIIQVEARTADRTARARATALGIAVVASAAVYASLCWGVRYVHGLMPRDYYHLAIAHTMRGLVVGGSLAAVLYYVETQRRASERLHLARLANSRLDQQVAEMRLQHLQSQIEPHFLFNCLASVKRLYENDEQAGHALLLNLVQYLEAAGSRSARAQTTVADELRLARSMLAIFQVRMGARLKVTYDVPAELETARIPPLMLGTLLENAIKHGISPRAAGGCIEIRVRRDGETLELAIDDDGVGFRESSGEGIGLANTRARLATLFGDGAELRLARAERGGVKAAIRVPYRRDEMEVAA